MKYYNTKRQKDGNGANVSFGSSSWGSACQIVDYLLLRTRTLQAFLTIIFLLVMTLFLFEVGERSILVVDNLSLPPWPHMNNLKAVINSHGGAEHLLKVSSSESADSLVESREASDTGKGLRSLSTEHRYDLNDSLDVIEKFRSQQTTVAGQDQILNGNDDLGNHHAAVRNTLTPKLHETEAVAKVGEHSKKGAHGFQTSVKDGHPAKPSRKGKSIVLPTKQNLKHVKDEEGRDAMAWVEFPYVQEKETEHLLLQVRENGTVPCHRIRTNTAQVTGLPSPAKDDQRIHLYAGPVYELSIISIGEDGQPRCAGGDYYETDLSGPRWKSRPPIIDNNNGTYSVKLQVDPRFSGVYTFKVVLLFSNFHGLHYHPQKWARVEEVATLEIEFSPPEPLLISRNGAHSSPAGEQAHHLELPLCTLQDFEKKYWTGRWTRETATNDCEYSRFGRWLCVDKNLTCTEPWCAGRVGMLESNGWVYSAHCAFKLFEEEEAWQCLDKKWLFFWGDSNHIDTIRNLLNFFLGFDHKVKFLDRRMDTTFVSPKDNRSSVRITSMFNGHSNVTMNYEGLYSLHDAKYQNQLRTFFTGDTAPDVMIMNSGLHDGVFWRDLERFMKDGLDLAVDFWTDVWSNMTARRPDLIYRTTVSTGGNARNMSFNPQKMELFNHLIVDRLARMNLERFHVVDGFDYTYAWHYDHKTNDGVHYGRPPSKSKWAGGNLGHRYFVDLMLVHMLLNAICIPS